MASLTKDQILEFELCLAEAIQRYGRWPEKKLLGMAEDGFRPVAVSHACFEIRDLLDTIHEQRQALDILFRSARDTEQGLLRIRKLLEA